MNEKQHRQFRHVDKESPEMELLVGLGSYRLKQLAVEFSRDFFDGRMPEESRLRDWEETEINYRSCNGGYFAVQLYYFFQERAMDFVAYVHGRLGVGMPRGITPRLSTRFLSLFSSRDAAALTSQKEFYAAAKFTHDAALRVTNLHGKP